jgi:hypothetical protein
MEHFEFFDQLLPVTSWAGAMDVYLLTKTLLYLRHPSELQGGFLFVLIAALGADVLKCAVAFSPQLVQLGM